MIAMIVFVRRKQGLGREELCKARQICLRRGTRQRSENGGRGRGAPLEVLKGLF